jgi:hypothetical protein
MPFNLKSAVEEFETKYIGENGKVKDATSREMIESLMNSQRDAVEAGIKNISELDSLTDLIYGKAVEAPKSNGIDRTKEVNQDVVNRTLKELEATRILLCISRRNSRSLEKILRNPSKRPRPMSA